MTTDTPEAEVRDKHLWALRAFGCVEELVGLLSEVSPGVAWVARLSVGERGRKFYIVAPDDDADGALYLDPRRMLIALDPEDAHRVMVLIGTTAEERDATWRVRITPEIAVDQRSRPHVLAAIERSLARTAASSEGVRSKGFEPPTS